MSDESLVREAGSEPAASIRVVVADDSYLVREALLSVLEASDGIEIVATCRDRDTLLRTIDVALPDVVITDIRMPPTKSDEGLQVAAILRHTHPDIGVVILSQFVDASYALALLEEGSSGRAYLLKERIQYRGQLAAAVREVAAGRSVIDPIVVESIVTERSRVEDSQLNELTPRELEILGYVARGLSNQAIADELYLTKRAVEKHINAIFLKLSLGDPLEVSRRVKAALLYLSASSKTPGLGAKASGLGS